MIPPRDEFGVPGPVGVFQFLLPATFLLHVLFMNVALGTAVLAPVMAFAARSRPHVAEALRRLLAFWPIAISMTITTGVAPLLFAQVLYGHLFYTSNILLGWTWLSILLLLLTGFYAVYLVKPQTTQLSQTTNGPQSDTVREGPPSSAPPVGGLQPAIAPWRIALLIYIAVAFVGIAAIFTANSTLMTQPDAWPAVHAGSRSAWGVHAMLWPRLAHNVIGSLAITGLFIAGAARVARSMSAETRERVITLGLLLALVFTGLQILTGVWFVVTIFHDAVSAFHQVTPGTVLWGLAVLTGLALMVVLFRALEHPERPRSVWLPVALAGFTLLGMSAGRERVRASLLHNYTNVFYTATQVRPQTVNLWLFFAILVIGLGLIAMMLRWMTKPHST